MDKKLETFINEVIKFDNKYGGNYEEFCDYNNQQYNELENYLYYALLDYLDSFNNN